MTLERYKEAVKNGEPRYYLTATTSKSFARTFGVRQVTLNYGPYLRLSTVKRKAAKMRKERALYTERDGTVVDAGPTFARVEWREAI
jgi:hypothetical protein